MLCESKVINKNPKYRVIKYGDEYLMVDLVSTWLTLFLPMINWLIPKKYVKISKKEFDDLNIVKPVKNKAFWPVAGSTIFNRLYWLVMTAGFFLLNMSSIIDKKIYVLSKNNMVEK
ncbi:DUF443 domain-containing protein [Staphylococcus aureus]|uniref:DUF443 domain-containing protein n=1 Tax=Staphylococcus aureus TaxID=1280 RepID=UPI0021479DC3|nr:DUF443 domain-containing protein [Staphylococcus aureus]